MLLAFDTSSSACTVALFDEAGQCVASADEVIGRGHAERLMPLIAQILDGRSAQHILVGVGPGSFTGIRVAIAAAPWPLGYFDAIYGVASLVLGAAMMWLAIDVYRHRKGKQAGRATRRLFAFSILYLFALFATLLLEVVFRAIAPLIG